MADSMQNYGLIRKSAGHAVLKPIPLPRLLDDYVLIRVVTVAINPTDWTTLEATGDDGTLVGCDWAGIVQEIGPAVTKDLRIGDRVAGCAHGGKSAGRIYIFLCSNPFCNQEEGIVQYKLTYNRQ